MAQPQAAVHLGAAGAGGAEGGDGLGRRMLAAFRNLGHRRAEDQQQQQAQKDPNLTPDLRLTYAGLRVFKVVMLGAAGVGKTTLIEHLVCSLKIDCLEPVNDGIYRMQKMIDGEIALLDVLDTGHKVNLDSHYMYYSEGFMIVYSVCSRRSFNEAVEMYKHIRRLRGEEPVPVLFIGNKTDIVRRRRVSVEEGQDLGEEHNCPVFETTATNSNTIVEPFNHIVRSIRKKEEAEIEEQLQQEQLQQITTWQKIKNWFAFHFNRLN